MSRSRQTALAEVVCTPGVLHDAAPLYSVSGPQAAGDVLKRTAVTGSQPNAPWPRCTTQCALMQTVS